MEELGFFNEREAECFEREDTLSLSDLEKLNVNEDLPEMERAEQLLKTGLDKQKISLLSSLPKILASNNTKSNLVFILDCMKFCREEKNNAVFLLSDEQVAKLLVPLALDTVSEIQQKDYAEDASLAVIASLSRLGGSLKKTQMMALCQDTDAEVRKFAFFGKQVKQTAFLALLSLLDFFPAAERIKRVIPEFLNMVESHPDYLVRLLAEQYGDLVIKLAALSHLGGDNAPVFLQGYAKLCVKDDIQLRQYCAYNFPAIVKAFGGSYVPLLMDDLLVKLSNDPVEKVRYHVAAGIHEVVLLLRSSVHSGALSHW
ncbi:hypothetical protein FI667_g3922, partial [Globisporangium splendens]